MLEMQACNRCGLIQKKDVLFGLSICDSNHCTFYGCLDREQVMKNCPDLKYDENIYKNRIKMPNFSDLFNHDK